MTKKTIILIKATTLCSCMSLSAFSLFLMEDDDDEQVGQARANKLERCLRIDYRLSTFSEIFTFYFILVITSSKVRVKSKNTKVIQ